MRAVLLPIILAALVSLVAIPLLVSAFTFTRPLSYGAKGNDVVALQQYLKDQGYFHYGTTTGYFGPYTWRALAAFQWDSKLEPVGYLGPKSELVLNKLLDQSLTSLATSTPAAPAAPTATSTISLAPTPPPAPIYTTPPPTPAVGQPWHAPSGGGGGGPPAATPAPTPPPAPAVPESGATITISADSQKEGTPIGPIVIGTLSVVGGSGSYTFTKTADPDNAFTLTEADLRGSIVFDYETAPSHQVTITADNGVDPVITKTFTILVTNAVDRTAVVLGSDTIAVFDPASLNLSDGTTGGFFSALYDGRYVYYTQAYGTADDGDGKWILQYDTSLPFSSAASWKTIDLTTIDGDLYYNFFLAFDGHYLYTVPGVYEVASRAPLTKLVFARFDITKDFASPSSWQTLDLASIFGVFQSFGGADFDGRYIYYAGYYDGVSGLYTTPTVRYDTHGPFTDTSSWQSVDLSSHTENNFFGVSAHGQYVYLLNDGDSWARYNTALPFTSDSSWDYFDIRTLDNTTMATTADYPSICWDGPIGYMIPNYTDPGPLKYAIAYDSRNSFTDPASYTLFDLTSVGALPSHFNGCTSDARYVYFSPTSGSGALFRFDKTGSFTSPSSWERFDTSTIDPTTVGIEGSGAFSGSYIYMPDFNDGHPSKFLRIDGVSKSP
jgi:peptidoglycan hydrolase-like protein with peptidoglycan-binding domain